MFFLFFPIVPGKTLDTLVVSNMKTHEFQTIDLELLTLQDHGLFIEFGLPNLPFFRSKKQRPAAPRLPLLLPGGGLTFDGDR